MNKDVTKTLQNSNFFNLSPHLVLDCVERHGFKTTGELQQLNSYENRVFDIRLEDGNSLIAKFYRPHRWNEKTLLDEHQFEIELKSEGLAVAAPVLLKNGSTLDIIDGIYFTLFEKVRGRMLQEILPQDFLKIGRWVARLHNIGEAQVAKNRAVFGPTGDHKWDLLEKMYPEVSPEIRDAYFDLVEDIFQNLDQKLKATKNIRLHGDLHRGNILESPEGFVVVDFDDFLNGPSIQDLWMLLPDEQFLETTEFKMLQQGYSELRAFPHHEIELIPYLRAYRIVTYSGWILQRWNDPSFPKLFPDFGTYSYWVEQFDHLKKFSQSF